MITEMSKIIGFLIVLGSAALIGIIICLWTRNKSYVTIYRPYEKRLLNQNRLLLDHYIDYISKYAFGNYAAISIGMVLVVITLILFESDKFVGIDKFIMTFILFGLATASICFAYADIIHTNTQTPIIPINQRFKLVDLSIGLFQFGLYLTLFSILFFITLISLGATIISSIALIAILLLAQKKRAIKKERFFEYFNIFDNKGWDKEDWEFIDKWKKDQQERTEEQLLEKSDVSYKLDPEKYQKYEKILLRLGEERLVDKNKLNEIEDILKDFRDPLEISRKDQDIILEGIIRRIKGYEDLIRKIYLDWEHKKPEFIKFKEMAEELRKSLGISEEYNNFILKKHKLLRDK